MQQSLEEQETLVEEPAPGAVETSAPGSSSAGRGPGLATAAGLVASAGIGAAGGAVAGAAGAVLVLDYHDDDEADMDGLTAQLQAQQTAAVDEVAANTEAAPLSAVTQVDDFPVQVPAQHNAAEDTTLLADEPASVDDAEAADAPPHHAHHAPAEEEPAEAAAIEDDSREGDSDNDDSGGGLEGDFEDAEAAAIESDGDQPSDEPHTEHHGHEDPDQPNGDSAGDEQEPPTEEPAEEEPVQSGEDDEDPVVLPEPVVADGLAPAIVEFTANGVVVQNLDGSLHVFDQDEGHFLLKPDGTREQVPGSPLHLISFDPASGSAVIDNIYDEQPPFILNQAGQLTFLPAADGGSVTGLDLIGSNALRGWARIATPDGQVYELRPNGEIYRINEYGFQTPFEGHIPGHLHLKSIEENGLVQVTYEGSVFNLHPDGSTAFVTLAPEAVNTYGVADNFTAAELAAVDDEPPAEELAAEEPAAEESAGGGGQGDEAPVSDEEPEPAEDEPVIPVAPEPVVEPEPVDDEPEDGEAFDEAGDVPDEGADELRFETLTFAEEPVVELQPVATSDIDEPEPAFADLSFVEGSGLADLNLSFANLDVFELDDDLDVDQID